MKLFKKAGVLTTKFLIRILLVAVLIAILFFAIYYALGLLTG